ncbi:hypothetical protein BKI52_15230 [marine bacterium AO1-C]|nr:hypothetical protein BKI52_15230 [marine bacterium AO1-C]
MLKVDPQVKALLDQWAQEPKLDVSTLTPQTVRAGDKAVQKLQEPWAEMHSVKEITASTEEGEVLIKVYYPKSYVPENEHPVFIYFHGGGFVIDGESYESPIRQIAHLSNTIICAVEYSLAPENKYPKAVNEAIASVKWIIDHLPTLNGNKEKVALGGDSSGGNLAAVVALENQKVHIHPFKCLILIYPMLDATCSQPSIAEFANGYGFTKEKIHWYLNQYLPENADRTDPSISPLFAQNFNGFPYTFVASAECDPIRDEGEVFAEKLKEADVQVQLKRYPGMIHGFFQMAGMLNQGKRLIEDVVDELTRQLS